MLLDNDFDIIKSANDTAKFAGLRKVFFTSNIVAITDNNKKYLAANANVVDDSGELMYRVEVIFPDEDVVFYSGTYYGASYCIPVAYDKHHNRVSRNGRLVGRRIKGMSFELLSLRTEISESEFYNRRTGNNMIAKKYRIYTTAESLESIEMLPVDNYRVVFYDTVTLETKHITAEKKMFGGRYDIQFTTGIYAANGHKYANTIIDGQKVRISFDNIHTNITEPSRWAPYYIYRPVINGRGCTIKDHSFEINVLDTEVYTKNEWNEELEATVETNVYTLIIDSISKLKKTRS